jgi:hypothetical protein
MSKMIFTRYLYVKDEVEISLATSILEKKDDAIFWAYELYYSGYKKETFELLWKIYYYFFATLNPCFEKYFIKKHKEWLASSSNDLDYYVSTIVNNLIIRPFNLDVFILHKMHTHLEFEDDEAEPKLELSTLLETNKYQEISKQILETTAANELFEKIVSYFVSPQEKQMKYIKEWKKVIENKDPANTKIMLISRLMMFYSVKNNLVKGKSFYVIVEPEEIKMYETKHASNKIYPYKILQTACIHTIDKYNYLSLFNIARHNETNPFDIYHLHWLYYSSFSPIWFERIQTFSGIINHETKKVVFNDETKEEAFYDHYGYEPEEQKIDVQYKNIQHIQPMQTWESVYDKYKERGLFKNEDDFVSAFERIQLFE